MTRVIFIFFIFAFVSCTEDVIKPSSLDNDIEKLCKAELIFSHTPGVAVGILKNGEKKFYSFGVQNLSSAGSINEYTIFEIGSITKTFAALLYADLSLNNSISLNDSANMYLPSTLQIPSKDGESVSIQELLNHTSGLPREPDGLGLPQPFLFSEEQMADYLHSVSLFSKPGTEYLYSNTALGLSGYMIKQVTGSSFNVRAEERIFQPLGMSYTFCRDNQVPSENVAQGYYGSKSVDFYEWSDVFGAAGNIKSNMHDMLIYLDHAINTENSVLKDAFELTETPTFEVNENFKIGLGWHLLKLDDTEIIWHNGGTHGFHTFMGFNKDSKYGVVVVFNSFNLDNADVLALEILRLLRKY